MHLRQTASRRTADRLLRYPETLCTNPLSTLTATQIDDLSWMAFVMFL